MCNTTPASNEAEQKTVSEQKAEITTTSASKEAEQKTVSEQKAEIITTPANKEAVSIIKKGPTTIFPRGRCCPERRGNQERKPRMISLQRRQSILVMMSYSGQQKPLRKLSL